MDNPRELSPELMHKTVEAFADRTTSWHTARQALGLLLTVVFITTLAIAPAAVIAAWRWLL